MQAGFRCGQIAVVGRPNVGKSTLINTLLEHKLLPVSQRPQTTREHVLCVYEDEEMQAVFVDTPGVHKPRDEMNRYMVAEFQTALKEVNLALLLIDATEPFGPGDQYLLSLLREVQQPTILVLNKIDLLRPDQLQALTEKIPAEPIFVEQIFISALVPDFRRELLASIKQQLPEGPPLFPPGSLSDRTERYFVAELIRESVFTLTHQEVPHSTAVVIEEFKDREDGRAYILATIFVEAESQKGIIIGHQGQLLKQIGTRARKEIQKLLGRRAHLEIWVKVRKNWRRNPNDLREFGYR